MHVLVTHLIASTSEETREPFPFLLARANSLPTSFPVWIHFLASSTFTFFLFRLQHFHFFRWKISSATRFVVSFVSTSEEQAEVLHRSNKASVFAQMNTLWAPLLTHTHTRRDTRAMSMCSTPSARNRLAVARRTSCEPSAS